MPCLAGEKKLDDSLRLDVVELTRVLDMLPSLIPSKSGKGLISTPVCPHSQCMEHLYLLCKTVLFIITSEQHTTGMYHLNLIKLKL